MTPTEKADIAITNFCYKETAKEACDWIINEIELIYLMVEKGEHIGDVLSERHKYWIETKEEIEKQSKWTQDL